MKLCIMLQVHMWCFGAPHKYNEEMKGGSETERRKRSNSPPPVLIKSVTLFTIPQASSVNCQLVDRIDACVLPRQQGFPGNLLQQIYYTAVPWDTDS